MYLSETVGEEMQHTAADCSRAFIDKHSKNIKKIEI